MGAPRRFGLKLLLERAKNSVHEMVAFRARTGRCKLALVFRFRGDESSLLAKTQDPLSKGQEIEPVVLSGRDRRRDSHQEVHQTFPSLLKHQNGSYRVALNPLPGPAPGYCLCRDANDPSNCPTHG